MAQIPKRLSPARSIGTWSTSSGCSFFRCCIYCLRTHDPIKFPDNCCLDISCRGLFAHILGDRTSQHANGSYCGLHGARERKGFGRVPIFYVLGPNYNATADICLCMDNRLCKHDLWRCVGFCLRFKCGTNFGNLHISKYLI